MAKRLNSDASLTNLLENDDDGPTRSAKQSATSAMRNESTTAIRSATSVISSTMQNQTSARSMRCIVYEAKLALLYLIRGIRNGYMFRLRKESDGLQNCKYNEIIFKFEGKYHAKSAVKPCRYRYLQIQRNEKETIKITAGDLLNGNGDYSLPKYYRLFRKMCATEDNICDMTICSNIRFDEDNLKQSGMLLVPADPPDDIFTFHRGRVKVQIHYRLKPTSNLRDIIVSNLKANGNIDVFFERLTFVVNLPSESVLEGMLMSHTKKRWKLFKTDFQSDYIVNKMLNCIKEKSHNEFISSKEGAKMIEEGAIQMDLLRIGRTSFDYQTRLKRNWKFKNSTIRDMAKKLDRLLHSPKKIERITTESRKGTAAKIVLAIETISTLKQEESYLIISSSGQQENNQEMQKTLSTLRRSYRLLIVVWDDDKPVRIKGEDQMLISKKELKVILIGNSSNNEDCWQNDEVYFGDLSKETKGDLLSRKIWFEEKGKTIKEMIGCGDREKDINSFPVVDSMFHLVDSRNITIPSYNTPRLEKSLYIRRRVVSAIDTQFLAEVSKELGCPLEELQKECCVDPKGHIEWFVEGFQKSKIWEKMRNIVWRKRIALGPPPFTNVVSDNELIHNRVRGTVIIISGEAGSGKSTILSYYHEEIKKSKPDYWVIRMNLKDYFDALPRKPIVTKQFDNLEFVVKSLPVARIPFARSLLNHRLKVVGRIVLMLDGFNEIDKHCQEKTIRLMKTLVGQSKLESLYIATRTHLTGKLEDSLFQFAYTLDLFSKEDQMDCLACLCTSHLIIPIYENIREYARILVEQVTNSVEESEEKRVIMLPLMGQILVEFFKSELKKLYKNTGTWIKKESQLQEAANILGGSKFNLTSLYKLFIEKKLEQMDVVSKAFYSPSIIDHFRRLRALRKLAFNTILSPQKCYEIEEDWLFVSVETASDSDEDNKRILALCAGLAVGIVDRNEVGKVHYLHRTYAEYFAADHLYREFYTDEDKDINKFILNWEWTQDLIITEILVEPLYDGVRKFFDFMLKELVESVAWRTEIDKGLCNNIPNRFKTFALQFSQRLSISHRRNRAQVADSALAVAIINRNATTFKFLCDCLDATFQPNDIQKHILFLFRHMEHFYQQNSEVFRRTIAYYEFAIADYVEDILINLCKQLPPFGLKYSHWNHPEQKEIVDLMLQFMKKHKEILKPILTQNLPLDGEMGQQFRVHSSPEYSLSLCSMIEFFISNEYYDSHLAQFLELLSWVFADDRSFLHLLTNVLFMLRKEDLFVCRINKLLSTIENVGRIKVSREVNNVLFSLEEGSIKLSPFDYF